MATLKRKRHYKKDTAYLLDLYTLTFDENETLESLDLAVSLYFIYLLEIVIIIIKIIIEK